MPLFKFINASAWANALIQIYQCISLGQYQCLILSMYLPGPIPFLAPTGAGFLSALLPEFPSVIVNGDLVHLAVRILPCQENDSDHVMIV